MLQFDTWTAARELKEEKKNFAKRLSLLRLVTTVFFFLNKQQFSMSCSKTWVDLPHKLLSQQRHRKY